MIKTNQGERGGNQNKITERVRSGVKKMGRRRLISISDTELEKYGYDDVGDQWLHFGIRGKQCARSNEKRRWDQPRVALGGGY